MTGPSMRPFSKSLPMALLRARETTMRSFRRMLGEHELTEQQWRVLRALSATDGDGLEIRTLAAETFLLGPSLSRILAKLEQRLLIQRLAVATDQRRSRITLTAVGAALVATIGPESEARYREIEAAFGPKRYERLLGLLDELASLDLDTTEREAS